VAIRVESDFPGPQILSPAPSHNFVPHRVYKSPLIVSFVPVTRGELRFTTDSRPVTLDSPQYGTGLNTPFHSISISSSRLRLHVLRSSKLTCLFLLGIAEWERWREYC